MKHWLLSIFLSNELNILIPGMPKSSEVPPEEYLLEENEERSMIEPRSYDNPKLKDLISILIEWVNDELHGERIIVQDVEEDLYDGQVCSLDV